MLICKKLLMLFIMILSLGFYSGCHRKTLNVNRMDPETQLEHAMQNYNKGKYLNAKTDLTLVILNNAGSSLIEKAQFYLADTHYELEEYIQAIAEFEKLIRSLPRSSFVDDARYKIGLCYYELAPGYALDQENTKNAITQFNLFLEEFPNSDIRTDVLGTLEKCQKKLAKKEYKTGELYRKMGYYKSAIVSFDAVIEQFPDSEYAIQAFYWKAECFRKMSEWESSQQAFRAVIMKNNQSEYADKSRKKLQDIQGKIGKVE